MNDLPPSPEPQARLLQAVMELLHEQGPAGVSARALGERAAVSASAVNYHFGGREGLLARAFEAAAAQADAWRTLVLERTPPAAPPNAMAAWIASLVQELCTRPPLLLAQREFRQLASRWPQLALIASSEQVEADGFWREIARRCGLRETHGATLCDFAAGAMLMHGPGAEWAVELPWLMQTSQRLTARLAGARADLPGWDGWRAEAERRAVAAVGEWRPPSSEAALRMLDAAIEIVGRQGVEGLTHRAVAQAAGASLANVTHHFPGRADLVRSTFRRLHGRATEQGAAERAARSEPTSPEAFAASFADFMVDDQGAFHPAPMALEELILFAEREPEMEQVSRQLRAARGEGSQGIFADVVHAGEAPDRLDAHLLSTVLMGAIRGSYGAPMAERRAWLKPRVEADFQALFG